MLTRLERRVLKLLAIGVGLILAQTACSAGPAPAPPPEAGPAHAWRTPLGGREGEVKVDVVGDLVVVRQHGGDTATFDLATGKRLAVLVGSPHGASDSARFVIDPYGETAVLRNALVGVKGTSVAAVDLRSGKPLWRTPLPAIQKDGAGHHVQLVEAGAVDVVGFRGSILALDPATGEERWRKSIPVRSRAEFGEEEFRLEGCGDLVLVWTVGRLAALDPSSGSRRWAVPVEGSSAPLVSCGGSRVALAPREPPPAEGSRSPSRATPRPSLRLLDAATGVQVSRIFLPEGASARHLAGGRDSVVLALDAPQATSGGFTVHMEVPSGRILWRLELGRVLRLLADDASVHVLTEHDGRLLTFDRRTHELRWCLSAVGRASSDDAWHGREWQGRVYSMSWFAMGKTRDSRPRVILPLGDELAAFDPAPAGACTLVPSDPYVFVETIQDRRPGVNGVTCRTLALSRVAGAPGFMEALEEKVLWRRELPHRLQEPYPCEGSGSPGSRISSGAAHGFSDVIELDRYILVAHRRGVLALERASGRLVLDLDAPWAEDGFAFVDDGAFSLSGDPPCSGPGGGRVLFARCADRVLYFNGTTAAIIAGSPPAVEARATFSPRPIPWPPKVEPEASRIDEALERGLARLEASGVPVPSHDFIDDAVIFLGDRELFLRSVWSR
ncbi:outer membrane protein assembly factor BamB family protein [Anaeromyxobacter terrae]|uniref:outer membrane protein assembly factor BamB family protein n=1 Tax=Anaeromyxobacter terrae TaxID=2925406 RepID=UPI001F58E01F|nr:PQQ-binding-like beta-propeller repeat protein [Anaeromyxobacter sp. SG22]